MAVYKVPQNVEADDKLLGPFSFRQFIYLFVAAGAIALGWGLSRLFLPLAILPLPLVIFFGALALPLRKDQPMETYLAAIVSFYLKPRKRMWDPDGLQALIEITVPKTVEVQRTKDLSGSEAEQRLTYLADVVDSRGWSVRGVTAPVQGTSMNSDAFYEAQQAEDILDESNRTALNIDSQLSKSSSAHRESLIAQLHRPAPQPAQQPIAAPEPQQSFTPPVQPQPTALPADDPSVHLSMNPYPNMHQSVVQPLGSQPAPQPQQQPQAQSPQPPQEDKPGNSQPSPDIISLANNPDLSIETIAHEANRMKNKGLPDDEVVISLH